MIGYYADWAWLGNAPRADVRIVVDGGVIASVEPATERRTGDIHLAGLTVPGFANTHSHAFHRALRGRSHGDGGTFWTWRERMYALAGRLDPDNYHALARAVFAEMALAGASAVGEFHYLHHRPDGSRYDEPNAMGLALAAAANDAGVRITLLDACYLTGGIGVDGPVALTDDQRRFSDGTVTEWVTRVDALRSSTSAMDHVQVGGAVHSVRAVAPEDLPRVAEFAHDVPLHVHLSEQPAENEQCLRAYGRTPTQLLADSGVLGAHTTAVHATHLSEGDVSLLAGSHTSVALCPTTERDLADGIGPARRLSDAGCPLTLGSDQHAVIDMFEEARGLEMDERLATMQRGRFRPEELMTALTSAGQRSLGWPDAGTIAAGARADLTSIRLDSIRTAGVLPEQAVYAATSADVHSVIVDGRAVVTSGAHVLGDVGELLAAAIAALDADMPS